MRRTQMARVQAESQRLAAQLEELQASQTSRGIVLTLGDVLFDTRPRRTRSRVRTAPSNRSPRF